MRVFDISLRSTRGPDSLGVWECGSVGCGCTYMATAPLFGGALFLTYPTRKCVCVCVCVCVCDLEHFGVLFFIHCQMGIVCALT